MSLLDDKEIRCSHAIEDTKEYLITELLWDDLLGTIVACGVETDVDPLLKKLAPIRNIDVGSTKFEEELREMLRQNCVHSRFKKQIVLPRLTKHTGRPVITLDCQSLCKNDTIDWLERVSKLPKTPKPILILENITEIHEEDDVHDDPRVVRNLLLHSWKNAKNEFFNRKSGNTFTIVPEEFTVFITWTPDNREKLDAIWDASDGLAWIGNFEEYKQHYIEDYKDLTFEELKQ